MASKGRGFSFKLPPNEEGLVYRNAPKPEAENILPSFTSSENGIFKGNGDKIGELCKKLSQLDTNGNTEQELIDLSQNIKSICLTGNDLLKCIDVLFNMGLKNKLAAHTCGILCNYLSDLVIDDIKFKQCIVRKLQTNYNERQMRYLCMDKFIMDATLFCEIYHHLRLADDSYINALGRPIVEYCIMLVDHGQIKDIEFLAEQVPKCYKGLKVSDPEGLEMLLVRIRRQLISDILPFTAKAMLLELFEFILTNGNDLSENGQKFYQLLTNPIMKICK